MNHTRAALHRQKLVALVIAALTALWLFTPHVDRTPTPQAEAPARAR